MFGCIVSDGRDCADVGEDVFRWLDLMAIEKGSWNASERQLHIADILDEAACTEEKEARQRVQVRGADKEIYCPSGHSNTHWLPGQLPMENSPGHETPASSIIIVASWAILATMQNVRIGPTQI